MSDLYSNGYQDAVEDFEPELKSLETKCETLKANLSSLRKQNQALVEALRDERKMLGVLAGEALATFRGMAMMAKAKGWKEYEGVDNWDAALIATREIKRLYELNRALASETKEPK